MGRLGLWASVISNLNLAMSLISPLSRPGHYPVNDTALTHFPLFLIFRQMYGSFRSSGIDEKNDRSNYESTRMTHSRHG
jgi:hypothetical protein